MSLYACPRCGDQKIEFMNSYCFCWECGYSPEQEIQPRTNVVDLKSLLRDEPGEAAPEQVLERAS